MAATKKSQEQAAAKQLARAEYAAAVANLHDACNQVPQVVLDVSAQLATYWRDMAEKLYRTRLELPKRATLAEIIAAIGRIRKAMADLENPVVPKS